MVGIGTLTKNEQTVTELYVVDEMLHVDPSAPTPRSERAPPAITKALEVGSLCNNSIWRHEDSAYVGQSTDVALMNVLSVFGMKDQRNVCPSSSPDEEPR